MLLWKCQAAAWACTHPSYLTAIQFQKPAWTRLGRSCAAACAQPRLESASGGAAAAAVSSIPRPTIIEAGSVGNSLDIGATAGPSPLCNGANASDRGAGRGEGWAPRPEALADPCGPCVRVADDSTSTSASHSSRDSATVASSSSLLAAAVPPRPERDGSQTSSTSGRGGDSSSSSGSRLDRGLLSSAGGMRCRKGKSTTLVAERHTSSSSNSTRAPINSVPSIGSRGSGSNGRRSSAGSGTTAAGTASSVKPPPPSTTTTTAGTRSSSSTASSSSSSSSTVISTAGDGVSGNESSSSSSSGSGVSSPNGSTSITSSSSSHLGPEPRPKPYKNGAADQGTRAPFKPRPSSKPRLQQLLGSGNLAGAAACVSSLLQGGRQPPWEEASQVILGLCDAGAYSAAWRLVERVHAAGFWLPLGLYHALIHQAGKAGEAEHVLWLFRQQLRIYNRASVKVRTTVIRALLSCRRRRGLPLASLAYEAWLQLLATGDQLDVGAYLAGIHACVSSGRMAEGEALLPPLCAAAGAAGGPHVVASHNVLLHGAARAADAHSARRLFASMRARGVTPDRVTYNTLAAALVAAGEGPARARAVLEHAVQEGFPMSAWGFTVLLRAHATAGDLPAAKEVVREMRAARVAPTAVTYGVLLDAHVRAGDLAGACGLLEELEGGAAAARRRAALGRASRSSSGDGGGTSSSRRRSTGDDLRRREGGVGDDDVVGVAAGDDGDGGLPAPTRIMYNTLLRGLVVCEWGLSSTPSEERDAAALAAAAATAAAASAVAGDPPGVSAARVSTPAGVGQPWYEDQQQQQSNPGSNDQQQLPLRPRGLANRPQWTQPPTPSWSAASSFDSLTLGSGDDWRIGPEGLNGWAKGVSVSVSTGSGESGAPAGSASSRGAACGAAGSSDALSASDDGGLAAAAAAAAAVAGPLAPGVWSVEGSLRRMAAQGIEAGVDTYSILLQAMLKIGDFSAAAQLLDQLQGPLGPGADRATLTSLLVALGDSDDCEAALDVFDALQSGTPETDLLRPAGRAGVEEEGGGAAEAEGGGGGGPGPKGQQAKGAGERRRLHVNGSASAAAPRGFDSSGGSGGRKLGSGGAGSSSFENTLFSSSGSSSSNAPSSIGSIIDSSASNLSTSSSTTSSNGASSGAQTPPSCSNPQEQPTQRAAGASSRTTPNPPSSGTSGSGSSSSTPSRLRGVTPLLRARKDSLIGGPDVVAWNALVNTLASAGRLQEAEAALDRAVAAAAAERRPPPAEAFGALIKGLRRRGDGGGGRGAGGVGGSSSSAAARQASAQRVLRRFLHLGGQPTRHMCDDVIALCLAGGDVRAAWQVVRVMRLTGVLGDDAMEASYRSWLERRQAQMQQREQRRQQKQQGADGAQGGEVAPGGAPRAQQQQLGFNPSIERLKWWFGVPNAYYSTDA